MKEIKKAIATVQANINTETEPPLDWLDKICGERIDEPIKTLGKGVLLGIIIGGAWDIGKGILNSVQKTKKQ